MNGALENEIIHRRQQGQSIRSIARDLGVSRRRVTRVINQQQHARDVESITPDLARPSAKRFQQAG